MILERHQHEDACFVTLTYNDENLPQGGTLVPRDPTLFLKKLRKAIEGSAINLRYDLVGEYGDETQRPHYHLALYGLGEKHKELIQSKWSLGFTLVGSLTIDSAQYIAGYVTKKMTSKADPRLNGRHPEFARMSRHNGGLGAGAMKQVATTFTSDPHGVDFLIENGDVPNGLQYGGKSLPLGRYLKTKLREECGYENTKGQPKALQKQAEQMHDLLKDTLPNPFYRKQTYLEANKQKMRNIESRTKLFTKGKKL
jgi:hypothetical protein